VDVIVDTDKIVCVSISVTTRGVKEVIDMIDTSV